MEGNFQLIPVNMVWLPTYYTFLGILRYFSLQQIVKLQKYYVNHQSIFLVWLNIECLFLARTERLPWSWHSVNSVTHCVRILIWGISHPHPLLWKKHYYWNRENHKYAVIVVYFSCSKCSGTNCTILKVPKKVSFFPFSTFNFQKVVHLFQ